MTRPVIEAFESPRHAAEEAARAIAEALRDAVAERGEAVFMATGGRSPGPVYDLLAREPLAWEKIAVTLTDERWVDPASPQSNERLVRERLFVKKAAAARLVGLWSDHAAPEGGVEEAQARLAPILPADVALVGVGEDGHVASLPPGRALDDAGLAVAVPEGFAQPRLSLTLRALPPRRLTVLLISGEEKRRVVETAAGLPVHRLLSLTDCPVRVIWSP